MKPNPCLYLHLPWHDESLIGVAIYVTTDLFMSMVIWFMAFMGRFLSVICFKLKFLIFNFESDTSELKFNVAHLLRRGAYA